MTCCNNKPLRILVIGTLPPPLGGTTVLLKYLVESLQDSPRVELRVVDTGGIRGKGLSGFYRMLTLPFRIVIATRPMEVVTLHCCTGILPILGVVTLLLTRFLQKPLLVRKFGGTDYRYFGPWLAKFAEFVLRHADQYFAETQQLVEQAKSRGLSNVRWFPNHRPFKTDNTRVSVQAARTSCNRFIYVGHVRKCKGIKTLAEAASKLPEYITVDVYGPWFDDLDRNVFDACAQIRYRGVIKPKNVVSVMRKYDAFIYPTHHDGEGYPGAIMEAYCAGLPVVATRWRAIPEIVDESVGILVEPKNATELYQAMIQLTHDKDLYRRLSENTFKKAEFFSVDRWTNMFIKECAMLANKTL